MSKHTPGPWKYFNNQIIYDAGYGGPFKSVCEMNGNNNESNASVISAAPEMLEALEKALPLLDASSCEVWVAARQAAASAIKKARGEK